MQPRGPPARGSPSRERWARPRSPGRGGRRKGSPRRHSRGRGSPSRHSLGRGSRSRHSLGRGSRRRHSRSRRDARRRSRPPTPPRQPPPLPPPPPMDENAMIIRQIMAKKMEEWERMRSSNRQDVRGRSFENFRKLVDEEVDMANKIHSKKRLKELMEQKLECFDRLASETHALLRSHAESKFKEIGEKEMALAKSVGPSRVRVEAEAKTKLAEERRRREKDEAEQERASQEKKSKEEMIQQQFYGYPPWMRVMDYPRMPGGIPGMMTGLPFTSWYSPAMRQSSFMQLMYGAPAGIMQGVMPFESTLSSSLSLTNYMGPDQALFPSEDFAWPSMSGGGLNSDFMPHSFNNWSSFSSGARNAMAVPVTESQGSASASEIDKKLRLLAQLEAARGVLQNLPIGSSASMAKEIRKRLKKLNRLQMKVIDGVLGYNPDLMSEIVSELMPTQFERDRFYGFGSDSSGLAKARREREAFGRERLVCPLHDYNIGTYCCPPQELPPHTHYREFSDFYPVNVLHYHEQPPSLHPADAVFDMPPVFPAPTYSVLDLPSYRGHENQPHNFDMIGYAVEDSGVVEQGSSPNDPYYDGQPRVVMPTKKPKFLSQTTIIVNRREQAAQTDTVPVPAEQVLVEPVQEASVAAVPVPAQGVLVQPEQEAPVVTVVVPAQKTVLAEVSAVPLQPTQVALPSPPVRDQPLTPTAFADENFVRECEDNLIRIAKSVENMLHSLCTLSLGRPRGRRQQGRRHFDEDYCDDGDDYDDYDEFPPHYRKNASKSRPSERRRRHPRDKDGPSLWNWLRQCSSNLRDRAPFATSHNDAQLIQAAKQIRELTRKITEASTGVYAARKAIQQLGLQDQQATQALMTAEAKLWRLIDLEAQLANEIARYRLLNTNYDQSCRGGLVEAEEKIRGLIQAETQLAGEIAGYRQRSQQRAGPTMEETPVIPTSTTATSSSTSSPTSRT